MEALLRVPMPRETQQLCRRTRPLRPRHCPQRCQPRAPRPSSSWMPPTRAAAAEFPTCRRPHRRAPHRCARRGASDRACWRTTARCTRHAQTAPPGGSPTGCSRYGATIAPPGGSSSSTPRLRAPAARVVRLGSRDTSAAAAVQATATRAQPEGTRAARLRKRCAPCARHAPPGSSGAAAVAAQCRRATPAPRTPSTSEEVHGTPRARRVPRAPTVRREAAVAVPPQVTAPSRQMAPIRSRPRRTRRLHQRTRRRPRPRQGPRHPRRPHRRQWLCWAARKRRSLCWGCSARERCRCLPDHRHHHRRLRLHCSSGCWPPRLSASPPGAQPPHCCCWARSTKRRAATPSSSWRVWCRQLRASSSSRATRWSWSMTRRRAWACCRSTTNREKCPQRSRLQCKCLRLCVIDE